MRKCRIIITILLLFLFQTSFGQERIVSGKILDEDLLVIPGAIILCNSKIIAKTDLNGNFEFKMIPAINKIEIANVGYQTEEINIIENCNHLEVILLLEGTYDFISLKSVKRKKARHRKKVLPNLYKEAYEKKLFTNEKSCR